MLRRNLGIFAICFGGAVALTACGGDDASDPAPATGGSSGAGASGGSGGMAGGSGGTAGSVGDPLCTDPGVTCTNPPDDPGGPAASGTAATVLAVSKLYLGDTDRQGNASPSAWKDIGFNIDGIVSTKTGTNHCAPVKGANPANVKTDGTGGIDNSFGANLIPLITSLAADASTSINQSITDGSFTIMVKLDNYSMPTENMITASLYGGADKGTPAVWGGEMWPVVPELLNGGDINDPKVKFPTSYINNGSWVSGSKGTLDLSLSVQGFDLALKIQGAQLSMDITGTGTSAKAVNGTISGVLETEVLIAELKKVAGNFSPDLCMGTTFDSIAQTIRAGSDIMADGSNGDSSQTCNAISVGLGFDAEAVTLGAVAAPSMPGPDPCAP